MITNRVLGLVSFLLVLAQAWPRGRPRDWHISWPHSIQDAIDGASPGDKIFVGAGTYTERLLIKKNGLSLIGHDVTLVPPSSTHPNDCSEFCGPGTHAGICVAGEGILADDWQQTEHRKVRSVRVPVTNVLIQGFHVKGFDSASVFILGGQNVRVHGNEVTGGVSSIYGFLSAGSTNITLSNNIIRGSGDPSGFSFVAACNDNFKGTEVFGNDLSAYFIGFCIQTTGSYFHHNTVTHTCAGAYVDPYVSDVTLQSNNISESIPACGGFGAWGVYVGGAERTQIIGNRIEGITNSLGDSAGVAIEDEPCTQLSLACVSNGNRSATSKNNKVFGNLFDANTLDLRMQRPSRVTQL